MMEPAPSLLFPPFRLDLLSGQVWRGTQLVPLRPKTLAVLRYLIDQAGRVVSRAEILQAVWPDTYRAEGLPKECIHELRQALGDNTDTPQFIETVGRRQGYRWIAQVTGNRLQGTKSRVGAQHAVPLFLTPPLVGREAELMHMHRALEKALGGERQVVFVTGEPGIGKTTLVETFLAQMGIGDWGLGSRPPSLQVPSLKPQTPSLWVGRGQCIEHYGAGEAYLPVLEALGRLCRQPGGEQVITLLERYAPTWLVQMPTLMSDTAFAALQSKVHGATRERMLRELAEALEVVTAEHLLVLILEDLQWSDYSTLDWLAMVARRREQGQILILGTYRPAEVIVSKHPLKTVKEELHAHGQCKEVLLRCLTVAEVSQYLAQRFAAPSPASQGEDEDVGHFQQLAGIIHRNTEGNPLFMVNVVDELVKQGVIQEIAQQWQLQRQVEDVAVNVPENLRQLIDQQLGRLSADERQVLEIGSVAGMEFSAAVVAVALEAPIEQIEEWCEQTVRRDQFLQALGSEALPDGTVTARYSFRHALYQTVLYERLSGARRIRLHRRVGEGEERLYGNRAGAIAAELAVHFERGQDYGRAIQYIGQGAQNALRRSAHHEAVLHLSKGLVLLQALPETPARIQHELTLQLTLGGSLMATKGFAAPEVAAAYGRARELCRQIGETPELFPVLLGLFRFYIVKGEFLTARQLGEQLLDIARDAQDPALLLEAVQAMGNLLLWLGKLDQARAYLEQTMTLYDPQQHHSSALVHDPGVVCLSHAAWVLWTLGYPEQALKSSQEAVTLAQTLAHPHSLALALNFAAVLHQLRGERYITQERAEAGIQVSTEHEFPLWVAYGTVLQAWTLTEQGEKEQGMTQMRQGLAALQAMGAALAGTYLLAILAEKQGAAGQATEGLTILVEALAAVRTNGECFWEAELCRLKGQLLLQCRIPGSQSLTNRDKSKVQSLKSKVKVSLKQSAKK